MGYIDFCGPIEWSFKIDSAFTNELKGSNTLKMISFAPPTSIYPGNTRSASLRATLKNFPLIGTDNNFDVIAYTA